MIRAVLSNGVIQPVDPLPPDWPDGQELQVEPAQPALPDRVEDLDRWYQELESLCAAGDSKDDQRLQARTSRSAPRSQGECSTRHGA